VGTGIPACPWSFCRSNFQLPGKPAKPHHSHTPPVPSNTFIPQLFISARPAWARLAVLLLELEVARPARASAEDRQAESYPPLRPASNRNCREKTKKCATPASTISTISTPQPQLALAASLLRQRKSHVGPAGSSAGLASARGDHHILAAIHFVSCGRGIA